jgi:hypothetical protein
MSTRSVIAVTKGDSWEGVYVHSDGYPTNMGPEVWTTLRYRHNGNVADFAAQEVQAHTSGYSSYPDGCYCHAFGKNEDGPMVYTAEDEDDGALFIEWVYVVGRHVLSVFKSVPTGREQRQENSAGHWWMRPVYRWALVQQVDLQGCEPDWGEVEARGRRLRDEAASVVETQAALAL